MGHLGFRTGPMARRAKRDDGLMSKKHYARINGRVWQYNPPDRQCAACYTREQPASKPRPSEAHAGTPHPTDKRRRIYWIFLIALLIPLCLWLAFLPLDQIACAAGVC